MWGIELDKQNGIPLKRQLYVALKACMMSGQLQAQEALPSTRALAAALGVSRSTVCEAYDMLIAEGFVLARQGAPTRVAPGLMVHNIPEAPPHRQTQRRAYTVDFKTGQPDISTFPRFAFERSLKTALSALPDAALGYTGPQGLPQLRKQIASWLMRSRGICADAQDIFITAGATHALHIIAGLLGKKGPVLMEDPCHMGMRRALEGYGCKPIPIGTDAQGLITELLPDLPHSAVYVTPSHQFPLGGVLSASRRVALIRYARQHGSYIIEDDYDSEFRYVGEPIAPLFTMDSQRVIYVGTFSKTLYPALRIGFVILPRALQESWRKSRTLVDVQNPVFEQAALADFLLTRRFDRHVQKMRRLYGQRRRLLLTALENAFPGQHTPWGDAAGLHIAVAFNGRRFDAELEEQAKARGINITPVMRHCIASDAHADKLLLGYGHLQNEQIEQGVTKLAQWLLKG